MVGRLHGKVWGLDLKITSVSLLGQNFWGRWTRLRTMYSDEDVTCVFFASTQLWYYSFISDCMIYKIFFETWQLQKFTNSIVDCAGALCSACSQFGHRLRGPGIVLRCTFSLKSAMMNH